ncbi:MAG: PfkB family carbohydrate kinase [Planctomycetaceae bacterium]
MSYELIDVVQRLGRPRVLVIGDLILDRYVWGDAERVSQEAPVILLREDRRETRLGGAANVANLLRGLEIDAVIAGVIGDDDDGRDVQDLLTRAGVDDVTLLADPQRPTTVKRRFIGLAQHRHPHQMLRVDREVRTPISGKLEESLIEQILACLDTCDAVLISDYAKGVCTPRALRAIIDASHEADRPVIVDPASSVNYLKYRGATAITPNRSETGRAAGRPIRSPDDAFSAGRRLCLELELDHCFVTLDSDGIALVNADGSAELHPTRKREVYDITGAGDMVLAMIGVGAAAGIAPSNLARLANVAGGLQVEQVGVVRVDRQQILADLVASGSDSSEKICTLDELARHVEARKRLDQRIVLTNGCFDVLHVGHVRCLQQAAREGDCLIVAVNSDDSVRRLGKGADRPVFGDRQRCEMLAALEAVDYIVTFEEDTPHALLQRLQPHLLVKGGTYAADDIVGRELVEAYGGQVKALGCVPGVSSTDVIAKIRSAA